jgi:hypothetical protein
MSAQHFLRSEDPDLGPVPVAKHDEARALRALRPGIRGLLVMDIMRSGVSRRGRMRRMSFWDIDTKQTVERHQKLKLSPEVDQADENVVGTVRYAVHGARQGDLSDSLCPESQPFLP